MRKVRLILLSAAAGAALTFATVNHGLVLALAGELAGASGQDAAHTYRELQLFGKIYDTVRADYVDKPDGGKLIEGAINGMVSSLDPHSNYMDAKSFRDMQASTNGEFGGLGIEVMMQDGQVKVVSPIDQTPAARAGVRANDLITAIDGEPIKGLTLQQAVEKIRGPVNSTIRVTLSREGEDKPIELQLTREVIQVRSVTWRAEGDDIGYIRISQFNAHAAPGLKTALNELSKEIPKDKFKGYILDLRNNPGGLLNQAVKVSNTFISSGEIVSTRGRDPDDGERFDADHSATDPAATGPLIVLINGGSASASEIVAGALQDHARATILGTRSFGKGSVQTIIALAGDQGALRLTTARYFTPSGRSIQALGITPDIEVLQDEPKEMQAQDGKFSESSLRGHLKAAQGQEMAGSQAFVPKDAKDDRALHVAEDLLRGKDVDIDVLTALGTSPAGAWSGGG
jgi:carboxyl-terminal processing protease